VFLQKAALRPIPASARVEEFALAGVEEALDTDENLLQDVLDQAFRELDKRQPELAEYLAGELAERTDDLAQSLGYFLVVAVYMAFREAFPTRLGAVTPDGLESALMSLDADETLRANDPKEVLESDDVIAMGQPHIVEFVQSHVQEALEGTGDDEVNLDDVDAVYRAVLIEIIALSHAVDSELPTSDNGEFYA
jgi:hypothetical protein